MNIYAPDNKEIIKTGNMAAKRADSLSFMLEKLLAVSVDTKGLRLSLSEFNIVDEVRNIISQYESVKNAHGNTPDIELSVTDSQINIYADKMHLINAVGNLLNNAVKYCNGNPVIKVKCHTEEGRLYISVKDNGIGISPENMKRIFDKYFRVRDPKLPKAYGFGLGLSYVKKVMDAHGGKVHVKCETGRGCEFILSMPEIQ